MKHFVFSFLLISLVCFVGYCEENATNKTQTTILHNGKLFPNGTYATVRGVTVIVPMTKRWSKAVNKALKEKAPTIMEYIAPLPVSSYHCTLHPLFTEFEIPNFVQNHPNYSWWKVMEEITPEMIDLANQAATLRPKLETKGIWVSATLVILSMGVSEENDAILLKELRAVCERGVGTSAYVYFRSLAKTNAERNELDVWFKRHFTDKIRGLFDYNFHVTLGYSRKIDKNHFKSIEKTLNSEGAKIVAVAQNFEAEARDGITTDQAYAAWFMNMEKFIPVEVKQTVLYGNLTVFDKHYSVSYDRRMSYIDTTPYFKESKSTKKNPYTDDVVFSLLFFLFAVGVLVCTILFKKHCLSKKDSLISSLFIRKENKDL